jgi:hypothetical protein
MHVPITLAGRLFGVLSATHEVPGRFGEDDLRRLAALGVGAAGAIAHALEFEHERRIARALTAGFVPEPPDPQTGLELGLLYEPVAHEVGGGDVFGVWTLPSLAVAVLIGDVSGKGLEVAGRQRDGALLRRGARVGHGVARRGARPDQPDPAHAPAPRRLRDRLPRRRRRRAPALTATPATRRPACCARAASRSRCPAAGCRSASRTTGRTRSARSSSTAATSSSPPPTGCSRCGASGRFFGDDRLPELLASYGARRRRRSSPSASSRGAGVDAGAARRRRRARAAARARARAARRAREQPGGAGAVRGVPGARARALGEEFEPTDEIFASERAFRGGARRLRRPLRARASRSRAAATARSAPEAERDQAHVRDRGRAPPGPRAAGAWPSSSGAARAHGRAPHPLLSTEVLAEARALYASAGYTEAEVMHAGGPAATSGWRRTL